MLLLERISSVIVITERDRSIGDIDGPSPLRLGNAVQLPCGGDSSWVAFHLHPVAIQLGVDIPFVRISSVYYCLSRLYDNRY